MEHPENKTKHLVRLETFSDGVFAIATTLLILEVIQTLHSGDPAEYLETESSFALAIFGFNYFMVSVSAYCFAAYVYDKLVPKEERGLLRYYKLLYKYSIIYTFVVLFICFLSVPVAMFLYFILFIVFAFPKEVVIRLSRRKYRKRKRLSTPVSTP